MCNILFDILQNTSSSNQQKLERSGYFYSSYQKLSNFSFRQHLVPAISITVQCTQHDPISVIFTFNTSKLLSNTRLTGSQASNSLRSVFFFLSINADLHIQSISSHSFHFYLILLPASLSSAKAHYYKLNYINYYLIHCNTHIQLTVTLHTAIITISGQAASHRVIY